MIINLAVYFFLVLHLVNYPKVKSNISASEKMLIVYRACSSCVAFYNLRVNKKSQLIIAII